MSLPDLAALAASVLAHAVRDDGVLGGEHAMLYALDVGNGGVQSGTRIVDEAELELAVVRGKLLLALSETPRTALCYLSVLPDPEGRPIVGLQIDARAEGPRVASFGVPLGSRDGRPVPSGELWALNAAASAVLVGVEPN